MSNADGLSVRCHGHGEHDQYKAGLSTSFELFLVYSTWVRVRSSYGLSSLWHGNFHPVSSSWTRLTHYSVPGCQQKKVVALSHIEVL